MDRQIINLIPVLAFAILVGLFAFNSNISIDSVHAEASGAQASLELDSVIDISAPNTVTLNCTPGATDASAELCTSNATVSITTNNVTGYTLQMNAASGSSNALTNTDITPNATIPTLSQAYSSANFPINSWGYTGGLDKSGETGGYNCATNYCPILAYESTSSNYASNHVIKVTDAPANNSSTTLTFGAKVNTTKPSGTYTTSITFTAVANYVPPTTMQDFDAEACARATVDQPFTLTDTRDGTSYTIAKLQDGNCWMTQNLALGSSSPTVLTQADSNVGPSGFTLPASVAEGNWDSSYTDPEFFDYAGNYPSQQASNRYGNYYNYSAATAGSDTGVAYEDVPYDICPKGWRLPSGNEYQALINDYPELSTEAPTTLDFAPLWIVAPGDYNSGIYGQDVRGSWWSSTAGSAGTSYGEAKFLSIHLYDMSPSEVVSGGRDSGQSVRCIVNKPVINNGMYMQDVTQEQIAYTPTDVTYTLKDKRDEKEYTVAKLQDGNLWMTQNLELGEYGTSMNLTNTLSNVSTSGYSLTFTNSDFTTYKGNSNKYGNFYTFDQVTAGSGNPTVSGDASYDICPKGWRLPSAGNSNYTASEQYNMIKRYINSDYFNDDDPGYEYWYFVTDTDFIDAPVSLVYAGVWSLWDSALHNQGTNGCWWSSTSDGSYGSYVLSVSSAQVSPREGGDQLYGYTARCLMPGT